MPTLVVPTTPVLPATSSHVPPPRREEGMACSIPPPPPSVPALGARPRCHAAPPSPSSSEPTPIRPLWAPPGHLPGPESTCALSACGLHCQLEAALGPKGVPEPRKAREEAGGPLWGGARRAGSSHTQVASTSHTHGPGQAPLGRLSPASAWTLAPPTGRGPGRGRGGRARSLGGPEGQGAQTSSRSAASAALGVAGSALWTPPGGLCSPPAPSRPSACPHCREPRSLHWP